MLEVLIFEIAIIFFTVLAGAFLLVDREGLALMMLFLSFLVVSLPLARDVTIRYLRRKRHQ